MESDDFGDFRSGVMLVDDWAVRRAHAAQKHGTARVFIVRCEGRIAGFYSLSAHSVVRDDVSGGWLRRNTPQQIPAVLLGMLGVDERYQGIGLGSSLLGDAIRRSLRISDELGIRAMIVYPENDSVQSFYEKYGFRWLDLSSGETRMFLPLA